MSENPCCYLYSLITQRAPIVCVVFSKFCPFIATKIHNLLKQKKNVYVCESSSIIFKVPNALGVAIIHTKVLSSFRPDFRIFIFSPIKNIQGTKKKLGPFLFHFFLVVFSLFSLTLK